MGANIVGLGNRIGFAYKKYGLTVYRVCFRYLKNHHTALDLRQEVFLKAIRSIHTLHSPDNLEAWLYRIAVNTCLDYIKMQKRRPQTTWLDDSLNPIWETEDPNPSHESAILLQAEINHHLQSTSGLVREIVDLYYAIGLSQEEIAQGKGLTKSFVSQSLASFRRKIRKYQNDYGHNSQRKGKFATCSYSRSSSAQPSSLRPAPGNRGRLRMAKMERPLVKKNYG